MSAPQKKGKSSCMKPDILSMLVLPTDKIERKLDDKNHYNTVKKISDFLPKNFKESFILENAAKTAIIIIYTHKIQIEFTKKQEHLAYLTKRKRIYREPLITSLADSSSRDQSLPVAHT